MAFAVSWTSERDSVEISAGTVIVEFQNAFRLTLLMDSEKTMR